jgi:hypothetical protein
VAEVTARSTSAAVAAEMVPRVLPVVGFSTVRVSLEEEGVNSLWMKRPVGTVLLVCLLCYGGVYCVGTGNLAASGAGNGDSGHCSVVFSINLENGECYEGLL